MRYKFLGDRDVPEWLLAEVNLLSRISCVRLKLICKQVISSLLGGSVDFAKVQRLIPKEKGFALTDCKAAVAAVHFVLRNAARFGVEHGVLHLELQQLGLPKENSDGIARPYRINRDLLRSRLRSERVSLPRVKGMDWRVDVCVAGSDFAPTTPLSSTTPSTPPPTRILLSLSLSHPLTTPQPPLPPIPARLSTTASSSSSSSTSSHSTPFSKRAKPLTFSTHAHPSPQPTTTLSLSAPQLSLLLQQLRKARDALKRIQIEE